MKPNHANLVNGELAISMSATFQKLVGIWLVDYGPKLIYHIGSVVASRMCLFVSPFSFFF